MKTNIELVEYVKKALKENWGYCLGTYGQILTLSLQNAKMRQGYGVGRYNTRHKNYLNRYRGKMVSDCYGLVKGCVWPKDSRGSALYVASQDRNQEGAFRAAREKGPIRNIPNIPGLVLWMKGHAGIYLGNGEFIECVGAPVGMRKGRISGGRVVSGSRFTHWFKDTYIKYDATSAPSRAPSVSRPSTSTATNKIAVDGIWGKEVNTALQKALGTPVDGIMSGQYSTIVTRSIYNVSFTHRRGSTMVIALQKKLGIKEDGLFGVETVRALQKHLGTIVDGVISKPSTMVRELQRRLNAGTF